MGDFGNMGRVLDGRGWFDIEGALEDNIYFSAMDGGTKQYVFILQGRK